MKNGIFAISLFVLCFLVVIGSATAATAPQHNLKTPAEPGQIPNEWFQEADAFLKKCEGKPTLTQYYNCDCLAAEYLQERIKNPNIDESAIMMEISHSCVDASEAAGYQYERCLGNSPLLPRKMDPQEYCTCYANTYAKAFERYKTSVNSKVIVELQTQAHIACTNPALAKKLFPFQPGPSMPASKPQ